MIFNYVMLALILCQIYCISIRSFPHIFVGFNVKAMSESLVKNLWRSDFLNLPCDWLATVDLRNKREKYMLEFEESLIDWISRVTRDSGQVTSDPRNSLLVAFWSVTFSIIYQHYINPHYPQNVRRSIFWRNFWERNPSQTLES